MDNSEKPLEGENLPDRTYTNMSDWSQQNENTSDPDPNISDVHDAPLVNPNESYQPSQIGQPAIVPPPPPPPPPGYSPPTAGTYYSNQQGIQVGGPKNDNFAIVAISTGIPAILLGCGCAIFGLVLGVIAITFGILSIQKINKSQGQLTAKGLAITGISTGAVAILFAVVNIALSISVISNPF